MNTFARIFQQFIWAITRSGPEWALFPSGARGWSAVNQWMWLCGGNMWEVAKRLYNAQCTCFHIELLGNGRDGYYPADSDRAFLWSKLAELCAACYFYRITLTINLTNANVGNKYEENGTTPLRAYSDVWFKDICTNALTITQRSGMGEHTWVSACSEWDGDPGARWHDILRSFTHRTLYNQGSRPHSAPDDSIIEYHPLRTDDYGPLDSYVVGDTRLFIQAFGEFRGHVHPGKYPRLRDYTATCAARGNGFCFYCFNEGGYGFDTGAASSIGRA